MARTLNYILLLSIIGVALCAPTEDVTVTEATASDSTHDVQAKGKSIGDWIKAPFEGARGAANFGIKLGYNVTNKAISVAENITVGAVEMSLKPVKFVGEKISTAMHKKWQQVHLEGIPAKLSDYPYVVRIVVGKDENKKLCGGAIIDKTWVLTAAHCFDDVKDASTLYVLAGFVKKQFKQVKELNKRASYNPENLNFDVALLELVEPLEYNNEVSSIDLPEKSDYDAENINEGKGVALGTSSLTKSIQFAEVTVMNLTACAQYYDIYYNQLCVTNKNVDGVGSCTAESGFPLIQKVNGKDILVALASYTGEDCKKTPTVYSRLSKHLTWINRIVNN